MLLFSVETRSDDAFGKFERGNRDKHADGNFSGFRGIEVFEEIVHSFSPVEMLFPFFGVLNRLFAFQYTTRCAT